ncbi:uncharacterized protein LOC122529012 [Frieseomelitta varia]|uniref:uncharacterized protein LOC122529012 n=1 Tax=Frieseomelitta varia TaxID=561572 RepID=UPI001CB6A947|nr:uncharacterized protein LOC122529012 [Frieseomelitta varia]
MKFQRSTNNYQPLQKISFMTEGNFIGGFSVEDVRSLQMKKCDETTKHGQLGEPGPSEKETTGRGGKFESLGGSADATGGREGGREAARGTMILVPFHHPGELWCRSFSTKGRRLLSVADTEHEAEREEGSRKFQQARQVSKSSKE